MVLPLSRIKEYFRNRLLVIGYYALECIVITRDGQTRSCLKPPDTDLGKLRTRVFWSPDTPVITEILWLWKHKKLRLTLKKEKIQPRENWIWSNMKSKINLIKPYKQRFVYVNTRGSNFWSNKLYVKKVSHVEHMHSDSLWYTPIFLRN